MSPTYTFTASGDRNLVANFTPVLTVQIDTTSSPPAGGVTSGSGSVTCGSSVMVSATPSPGYVFVDWTEGGAEVSASSNYTFTAAADNTLVANFTCPISITPTNATFDGTGGDGIVTVSAASDCDWTAISHAFWITLTSGTSGSSNETVTHRRSQHEEPRAHGHDGDWRANVHGQQAARANCIFVLKGTTVKLSAKGGSKTVKVQAFGTRCHWDAVSNDPFITITGGTPGDGDGMVNYTVPGNTNTTPLIGTMSIANQIFTVNQAAGGCGYSLSPKNAKFKAAGGLKVIKVKAKLNDCVWSAVSNDPFITLIGPANGVGSGAISYSVATNTSSLSLTGTVTIPGQTFTITQSGAP